jgi:hypothetical protein
MGPVYRRLHETSLLVSKLMGVRAAWLAALSAPSFSINSTAAEFRAVSLAAEMVGFVSQKSRR